MIEELQFPNPEKVFTPVYHKLANCTDRFLINYGGTGSSKSFSCAQKEVLFAVTHENITTAVFRKVAGTLKKSVIRSFKRRITEFDMWDIWVENKTEMTLTCTQTGSQIWFLGLDDPEKLKSIEGVNRVVIEEASELEEEDMLEVNRRVRGMPDIQITINFNPIHENHWLKKMYFDNPRKRTTVIKSTYHDNPFLSDEDREEIEYLKQYNFNQYRIYALGEWGITENNAPWLFAFNMEKHVKESLPFLPTYPVYLSFDFNREPISCLAAQMSPSRGTKNSFVHFIKEFSGNVQLEELCTRVLATFPNSILYVTGDASGNAGDVAFEQRNATYYKMIQSYLRLSPKQMNIFSKNMEHNDSRNLCNTMMHNLDNVYISQEGCPILIKDCHIATVDETKLKAGVLKKDREIYKMDMFDAFRYYFQAYFSDMLDKVRFIKKPLA